MTPFPSRLALLSCLILVLVTGAGCQSLIPLRGGGGDGSMFDSTGSGQAGDDSFGYRSNPGDGPARVGVLLPLSGKSQKAGKSMLNAAQLALFDHGGKRIELRVHDTKGTREGAEEAARKAVDDGVGLVVGPLFGESMRTVSPILLEAGVMGLGFSNDITASSQNMFAMGFLPEQEVTSVVRYALSKGITRFAVLAPETAYGQAAVQAMEAEAGRGGGAVVKVARFGNTPENDPRAAVKELYDFNKRLGMRRHDNDRLKRDGGGGGLDGPFQALLVAEAGRKLPIIAAQLSRYDMDNATVQILGTGRWDTPGIGTEQALVGAWFAAPDPNARSGFEERYVKTYKTKPVRIATLAYDAVALAATLTRSGGADFTFGALTDSSGFAGQDGVFRFHRNGVVERGFAIKQVQRDGTAVIAPAPQSFSGSQY